MKIHNKKGRFGDAVDILAIVGVLILFFFFVSTVLSGNLKKQDKISLASLDQINSKSVLLNYLRTPTENGLTLEELIIAAETNPALRAGLKKSTKKIILTHKDTFYKGINIKYPGEKKYFPIVARGGLTSKYAQIKIPGKKLFILITIEGEEKASASQARYRAATGFRTA